MPLSINGMVNRGMSPKVADETIAYITPERLRILSIMFKNMMTNKSSISLIIRRLDWWFKNSGNVPLGLL